MVRKKSKNIVSSLLGKFLLSMPNKRTGDNFYKSIIYVLFDSSVGSVGVTINQPVFRLPHKKIIEILKDKDIDKNQIANNAAMVMFAGGKIEPHKFILLHKEEYRPEESKELSNGIYYLFPDKSILDDILQNTAPKKFLFISGYNFWPPGHLKNELNNNKWLISNSSKKIMFMKDNNSKWRSAMNLLGAPHGLLITRSGNA